MIKRRKFLKAGALLSVPAIFGSRTASAQLCRPTGIRGVETEPDSPPVSAYTEPLFIPPKLNDVGAAALNPPIDPNRHQRYDEFEAKKVYEQHITEGVWNYHSDLSALTPAQAGAEAGTGSLAWMYSGGADGKPSTPGPSLVARYGMARLEKLGDDKAIRDKETTQENRRSRQRSPETIAYQVVGSCLWGYENRGN